MSPPWWQKETPNWVRRVGPTWVPLPQIEHLARPEKVARLT